MRIVYLARTLRDAHFACGVLRELGVRGHEASGLELARAEGDGTAFAEAYPELTIETGDAAGLAARLEAAELVIVHDGCDPAAIAAAGAARGKAGFTLLLHDTHARPVAGEAAAPLPGLDGYDGVLAACDALTTIYREAGWGERAASWHFAADTRLFHPPHPQDEIDRDGVVWFGNWNGGARADVWEDFLLNAAFAQDIHLDVYGAGYPDQARRLMHHYEARYRGPVANSAVPGIFARHQSSVHLPRPDLAAALPGYAAIGIFEVMACGLPLITAPWEDADGLFRSGQDYAYAESLETMARHMRDVEQDEVARARLIASALQTIRTRHNCGVRADALLRFVDGLAA